MTCVHVSFQPISTPRPEETPYKFYPCLQTQAHVLILMKNYFCLNLGQLVLRIFRGHFIFKLFIEY